MNREKKVYREENSVRNRRQKQYRKGGYHQGAPKTHRTNECDSVCSLKTKKYNWEGTLEEKVRRWQERNGQPGGELEKETTR